MRIKHITTGASVAAMSLAIAVKAHACSMHGLHKPDHTERRIKAVTQELDLNKTQSEKMAEVVNGMQQEFSQLREVRKDIKSLVQSDAYDEEALRIKAQAAANQMVESIVSHSTEMHELYMSLDTEQRQKLAEFEERRKRWHGFSRSSY